MARLCNRTARNPYLRVAARARAAVRCTLIAAAALCTGECARLPPQPLPGAASAAPTLAVATWNMHAGRGDLVRLVDDLASGRLTAGVPRDYVLLLQEEVERDNEPLGALAATRHLFAFFLPLRRQHGGIIGNAILSTQPFEDPRIVPLPRQRQLRAVAAANVTVAGERLFVASVHLENRLAWWKIVFSDTARGRQARALLQEFPAAQHGVLGGDLNTWLGPNEPAWREMLRRFPAAHFDTHQPTFHGRLVLDHLFIDLPAGWSASRRVVAETYGSDHHPVVAMMSAGPSRGVTRLRLGPVGIND
jgi:endonuclease/exonuclease/phosphatase family metal-dependent hydrolase